MTRKKRRYKYEPYKQVKMNFYDVPSPFRDVPVEMRRRILFEAAQRARDTFETEYPRLRQWFSEFDPLYILSFCVMYFLSAPEGVDKEATEGKLDFGYHHLELLQAFALMGQRVGGPSPLKERAEELKNTLKSLTDALIFSDVRATEDTPTVELKKKLMLAQMRAQTLTVRNWAFPEQTIRHLKGVYGSDLGHKLMSATGLSVPRLIDSILSVQERIEERLNEHIDRLRPAMVADDFESVHDEYHSAFPDMKRDKEGMRRVFHGLCGGNLRSFKSVLMMHSDLRLPDVFTFHFDDIASAYGDSGSLDPLRAVLDGWSHAFGDLAEADLNHFLYANPVLTKPFIRMDADTYFWVLGGIASHTLPTMLERIVPAALRDKYLKTRSQYLEEQVAGLCRTHFPNGQVFTGSQWSASDAPDKLYENDVLVLVDTTALVIEAKAHLVDAAARRGAEYRFVDTLEDQVVAASEQAVRFVEFLKANPAVHEFSTRRRTANVVDVSHVIRFVPVSVTLENLGFISANVRRCVEAGMLRKHPLVPSVALTDFEVALELLDSQAQRIHYFSRRAEVERTMEYFGDESDLLAFYLDSAFSIGDWEDGGQLISLVMKSKELDPYFTAKANGVSVAKPQLDLSDWWRDILARLEEKRFPGWTEVAYILLSMGRQTQDKFERQVEKLGVRVLKGLAPQKHNWIVMRNDWTKRPYAVIGYPYFAEPRHERNDMISHIAAECEEAAPVLGLAVLGIDMAVGSHPYDVLVYVPGSAPGAPDASRLPPMPN